MVDGQGNQHVHGTGDSQLAWEQQEQTKQMTVLVSVYRQEIMQALRAALLLTGIGFPITVVSGIDFGRGPLPADMHGMRAERVR